MTYKVSSVGKALIKITALEALNTVHLPSCDIIRDVCFLVSISGLKCEHHNLDFSACSFFIATDLVHRRKVVLDIGRGVY